MKHIIFRRKGERRRLGRGTQGCNFLSNVLFPVLEGGYVGVCYITFLKSTSFEVHFAYDKDNHFKCTV